MNFSRRKFFHSAAAGAAALVSIPAIISSCIPKDEKSAGEKYSLFKSGNTILFQGDSITDSGREKERQLPNNSMSFGYGYAFLAASKLLNSLADRNLTIYNRGISGNKVFQLAERWQEDCFELDPDIVSILIGVNDYWHKRKHNYYGNVEIYENDYRALLKRTKEQLPEIKLIICQPFAVTNTSAVDESWIEPMQGYQAAAKRMADEFNAVWVPFQEVFDEAVKYAPAVYWTEDGVHPSMAGAQLMAEAWLRSVE